MMADQHTTELPFQQEHSRYPTTTKPNKTKSNHVQLKGTQTTKTTRGNYVIGGKKIALQ
jgi:hypothetical protein